MEPRLGAGGSGKAHGNFMLLVGANVKDTDISIL